MKALFGAGVHPDAESRIRSAMARGVSLEDAQAPRLGRLFPVMDHSGRVWRERLGTAYQDPMPRTDDGRSVVRSGTWSAGTWPPAGKPEGGSRPMTSS